MRNLQSPLNNGVLRIILLLIKSKTMRTSRLYNTLLNKSWLIDLRQVDQHTILIQKYLDHDVEAFSGEVLNEKQPLVYEKSSSLFNDKGSNQNNDVLGTVAAIVPMHGNMLKEGTMCSYGTEDVAQVLRQAADDESVGGIVLDIDSGGGAVDAIAPMVDAIMYAQKKQKCVVASCDLCASAAYWVATACDEIIANNTISSEFGSIGVMMSFPDYAKYYENAGIKVHTIYSDLSTYKNAPFEAAKEGKYELIKSEGLNPVAKKFQDVVKSSRKNLDTSVEGIIQGRVFYAEDAKKYGLIDSIGNRAFAIERCMALSADAVVNDYLQNIH